MLLLWIELKSMTFYLKKPFCLNRIHQKKSTFLLSSKWYSRAVHLPLSFFSWVSSAAVLSALKNIRALLREKYSSSNSCQQTKAYNMRQCLLKHSNIRLLLTLLTFLKKGSDPSVLGNTISITFTLKCIHNKLSSVISLTFCKNLTNIPIIKKLINWSISWFSKICFQITYSFVFHLFRQACRGSKAHPGSTEHDE